MNTRADNYKYVARSAGFLLLAAGFSISTGCRQGLDARIDRAYRLSRRPTDGNKAQIEALLLDPDRDMRSSALVVMESIDPGRAKQMASRCLQDPDGLVRAAAVTILATKLDPETVTSLVALAGDDPVWQVRSRAIEALTFVDDPAVSDRFEKSLSDAVRYVRRAALRAGVARPGILSGERLADLVANDPDWENRVEAARALGASKDPSAEPALVSAMSDPNEFVRLTAGRERRVLLAGVPH